MFLPLTEDNISTLLLDGSVIFLLGGILADTGIMRRRGRDDDKLFFLLVILNMVMAVFDISTYLADGKAFPGARVFNMGGITAFYIVFILMAMVWYHYCLTRFRGEKPGDGKNSRAFFLPGLLTEVLLVINLFTGWFFYVDESNTYHHGVLFVPMFLVIGYFLLLSMIAIVRYRSGGKEGQLIPVWIFILPLLVGLLVPFYFGGISLTAAGCAMSVVFTHLGSAAEMVNYDATGGEKA